MLIWMQVQLKETPFLKNYYEVKIYFLLSLKHWSKKVSVSYRFCKLFHLKIWERSVTLIINTLQLWENGIRSAPKVFLLEPQPCPDLFIKFSRNHLNGSEEDWEMVIWPDESNIELSGRNTTSCIWRKRMLHYIPRTPNPLWSMSHEWMEIFWTKTSFHHSVRILRMKYVWIFQHHTAPESLCTFTFCLLASDERYRPSDLCNLENRGLADTFLLHSSVPPNHYSTRLSGDDANDFHFVKTPSKVDGEITPVMLKSGMR